MSSRKPCRALAVALPAALVLLAGCSPASTADVQQAAQAFQAAVRDGHTGAACGMLSGRARSALELTSGRNCVQALNTLKLPTADPTVVEVWGGNAQARWPGGALFLAEFRSGWKITAAGCRPRPDQPYVCAVRS